MQLKGFLLIARFPSLGRVQSRDAIILIIARYYAARFRTSRIKRLHNPIHACRKRRVLDVLISCHPVLGGFVIYI